LLILATETALAKATEPETLTQLQKSTQASLSEPLPCSAELWQYSVRAVPGNQHTPFPVNAGNGSSKWCHRF
jgi:hypothetical protein